METNYQLFRPYEYWHILDGTLPASDNAAPLRSLSAALRQVGGPRNDVAFRPVSLSSTRCAWC